VEAAVRLEEAFADRRDVVVTASNRAGMVYGDDARALAERLDGRDGIGVTLFLEDAEAVARRGGEELRFAREGAVWRTSGDASILDHPNALERAWTALHNPNAGDVLVSSAAGFEFLDLAGRAHVGGGSHGSLDEEDSVVPVVTVGVDVAPRAITDVAPLALAHFGVDAPPYQRALHHAA